MQGPLAGLCILDLAGERASLCGRLLADLGAQVIKIEPPGGDPARRSGVFDDPGCGAESLWFRHANAGKSAITLDIQTLQGRATLLDLVRRADAVLESFDVGFLDRLGISYGELSQLNPALVMVSVTGFGQTGPRRHHESCDLVALASGGQMQICGSPASAPVRPPGKPSYHGASLYGAIGLLLALARRRRSGLGAHIDISSQEVVASMLEHVLVQYLYDGRIAARQGDLSWNRSSFILPCSDGHIQVSIATQWETLVEWVAGDGMAEDLGDEKWRDEARRSAEVAHVVEVLARWTRTHTADSLFHTAQALRLPWAPVCSVQAVLRSPQLRAREFFGPHGLAGEAAPFPGMPYKFDGLGRAPTHAPVGEDNRRLCGGTKEVFARETGRPDPLIRSTRTSASGPLPKAPLEGLRVLDFTWVLAGPYATRILADFGAEVIKVQSLRTAKTTEANHAAYFDMWNRNKRGIALDMDHPEAREIVLGMVRTCDVVIENFSPRVMANWGLTHQKLLEINPRLIMVSVSAMGQTGPWRDYIAFGPTLHALSGLTDASSRNGEPPVGLGHAHGDHVIGLFGALAVLAALEERSRSGIGCYVDLSGYEAVCTLMGPALLATATDRTGSVADPAEGAPEGCYRCQGKDRWCVISVPTDDKWQALCRVAGHPNWLECAAFASPRLRRINATALDGEIGRWTAGLAAEQVVECLQGAGVAAAVVQDAQDLFRDPQLAARQFFMPVDHPRRGRLFADRSPIRFVGDSALPWQAAPELSADTAPVLAALLGLTDEQLAGYRQSGVLR